MPARLLGSLFLVMALQSVLMSIVLQYGRGSWVILLPSLALSVGPLLLLYFESLADTKYRFTIARSLHFLPAFLCLLAMLLGVFWLDPDLLIVISFALYTLALVRRASRGRVQFLHFGANQKVIFLWLVFGVIILATALMSEIFILYELQQGKLIDQSVSLLVAFLGKLIMVSFTLLSALQNPSPFDWITSVARKSNRPAPQSAEDLLYRALVNKFNALVDDEKLYLQDDVSLRNIATRLDKSQRHLSQAINHVHGESFSKRMNRLRVEEAKRLLGDPAGKSIIEVMLDSGFRTKSNFNKEFLALEGMSPSDFRGNVRH